MSAVAATDATHDATQRSWVAAANEEGTDFPLQNLPVGRGRARGALIAFPELGYRPCRDWDLNHRGGHR